MIPTDVNSSRYWRERFAASGICTTSAQAIAPCVDDRCNEGKPLRILPVPERDGDLNYIEGRDLR